MKTRWIIAILAACIALALYLRIALPYDNVFTDQWIKFTSNDAYWQMMHIDKGYEGSQTFFQWLISSVACCIGLGNPSQHLIDTVAVYFPPILAALTIVTVYFIGRTLFNNAVGLIAALLISVLPGEWLGRSLLGFTDHHVAEVLFSSLAILAFIIAIKNKNKLRVIASLLSLLLTALCVLSWTSGILIAGVIGLYLAIDVIRTRQKYQVWGLCVITAGVVAFIAYDYEHILRLIPFIASNSMITTQETRPILFPQGVFTPMALWGNFTTMIFFIPIALYALMKNIVKSREALLLVIWTIIMLTAMLLVRRFAYYFAVNAALLGGYLAYWIYQRFKDKLIAGAVVVLIVCLMVIPNYQNASITARYSTFSPSNAWLNAISWLEQNTEEDSLILSWWDYGYWIEREGKRHAFTNPSQPATLIKQSAQMFLTDNEDYTIDADYIIIDYYMVMGKYWAIVQWAGYEQLDFQGTYYITHYGSRQSVQLFTENYYNSLICRLYNFNGYNVIPTQTMAVSIKGNQLLTVDVYGSYEEAVFSMPTGTDIVGSVPFNSPIYLNAVKGYHLVYQSEEMVNGVPEVKIFKRYE